MTTLYALVASFLFTLTIWVWSLTAKMRKSTSGRAAESVQVIIGSHGLWSGVWLAEISDAHATRTSEHAASNPEKYRDPKGLAKLWYGAGAKLVGHLQGPALTNITEACGWLKYVANDLVSMPLVSPLAFGSRRLLAIVYVSNEMPRTDRRIWSDVEQLLGHNACHGSAFVLLQDEKRGLPNQGRSKFLLLTIFLGVIAGITVAFTAYVAWRQINAQGSTLSEPAPGLSAERAASSASGEAPPAASPAPLPPDLASKPSLPPPPAGTPPKTIVKTPPKQ